jgi:hypothetical protein
MLIAELHAVAVFNIGIRRRRGFAPEDLQDELRRMSEPLGVLLMDQDLSAGAKLQLPVAAHMIGVTVRVDNVFDAIDSSESGSIQNVVDLRSRIDDDAFTGFRAPQKITENREVPHFQLFNDHVSSWNSQSRPNTNESKDPTRTCWKNEPVPFSTVSATENDHSFVGPEKGILKISMAARMMSCSAPKALASAGVN